MNRNNRLGMRTMLTLVVLIVLYCSLVFSSSAEIYTSEILSGEQTELQCTLNNEATQLQWEHVGVGTTSSRTVASGTEMLSAYSGRFSIKPGSNYTLVISKTLPQDAGLYLCREKSGGTSVENELVVLESSPDCSMVSVDSEAVSENDCGVPVEDLKLTCSVRWAGHDAATPELIWKDVDGVMQSTTVTDDIATNSIVIKSRWNRTLYSCETQRSRRACLTMAPKPLFFINETSHEVIRWPQTVTCSVKTNLVCEYKWTRESDVVSNTEKLKLTEDFRDGEYKCQAKCQLKGHTCKVHPKTIEFLFRLNQTDSFLIILIVVLVVFGLSIVVLVFWMCLTSPDRTRLCLEDIQKKVRCCNKEPDAEDQVYLLKSDLDWSSESVLSSFLTISTDGHIKGITVLNDRIFVVRKGSQNIEEYISEEGNTTPESIPMPDLKEPIDLVSCKTHKRLYISDSVMSAIHIVVIPQLTTTKWKFKTPPKGLSVTPTSTVLVTFPAKNKIKEFAPNRDKLRSLSLRSNMIHPRHVIRRRFDSMLLVCNGGDSQEHPNLVFVTKNGKSIKQSYDGKDIFEEESMWPTRLIETSSGNIIVVARQTVLLLDPNLKMVKQLLSPEKNHYPSRMFLDEKKKLLYITENEAKGRILIYKISSNQIV